MSDEEIRDAIERNVRTVSLTPSAGQGTAVTRVRLGENLSCQVQDGSWTLPVGMPKKYGGTNLAPYPGVYGRAALGSCLAIGYAMWAARLGVPIDSLEIEVHADYDMRGELGVYPDARPGYSAMRYIVSVSSPASAEEVARVLDTADRFSSWRDNLANAVPLVCERRITSTTG
jgi:uncharacterized OsmC-like protein